MNALWQLIADFFVGLVKEYMREKRDEQLGALKQSNKDQAEVIRDQQKAKALDDDTRALSPAELEQLRNDVNSDN